VQEEMCNTIGEATGGRLEVEIYAAGSLVPDRPIHGAIADGTVEMTTQAGVQFVGTEPIGDLDWGIPFSFETMEQHETWLWDLGIVDLIREAYGEHNIYYLMPYRCTSNGSLQSTDPIETLEDLKGLKVRAFGIFAQVFTELGASIVQMATGETYTAVATGVVDAFILANPGIHRTFKFHEVARYFTSPPLLEAAYSGLIVNMDCWNELSDDIKAILLDVARASSDKNGRLAVYEDHDALEDWVENWGVAVNTWSDADLAEMRGRAGKYWDKIAAEDPLCAQGIAIMKDYMKLLGLLD